MIFESKTEVALDQYSTSGVVECDPIILTLNLNCHTSALYLRILDQYTSGFICPKSLLRSAESIRSYEESIHELEDASLLSRYREGPSDIVWIVCTKPTKQLMQQNDFGDFVDVTDGGTYHE